MSELLTFTNFTLEYKTFGTGKEVLFAFHGFNRNADDFKALEPSLGKHYKIVSFNLFFYGKSRIGKPNNHPVHYADLEGLLRTYLDKYQVERFSLMGYSLGGRVALSCLEAFPGKVNTLYLFAPDGLKMSRWYSLAMKSLIGQRVYKHIIGDPSLFFRLAGFLKNKRYITEGLYNFACCHMHTKEKRQQIFDVWMSLRKLVPDLDKIRKVVRHQDVRVHVILGKYDSVISAGVGKKFAAGLTDKIKIHVVNAGHNLITYNMNSFLNDMLDHDR